MAYQVTARKYRPQSFQDLIGQDHVRQTLQNALRRGRVAHAYIFSGPRGVGKTTVARLLAKAVNCEVRAKAEAEGKSLPDEPCNQCPACLEVIEDRHPDVIEIDGASNTGVDHIRDLREQVRYAPARGRYKVYVIDEVHMLSKGAFNALLKTLEEPPPGVIFIFATTEPDRIPATISSRCQCFDFHRLPPTVVVARLARIAEAEGIAVDNAALNLLSRTAEGSMRDAQSLFDQVVAYTSGREDGGTLGEAEVSEVLGIVAGSVVWKVGEMIARGDARGLLEVVRDIFHEGQDVKQFCLALLGFFRDLLVSEVAKDATELLNRTPEEAQEFQALAQKFGRERLYRCFRMTMDVERDIRLATNPQPVLEMSLLRMADLRASASLGAVLEKLRAVETAMGLPEGGAADPESSAGMSSGPRGSGKLLPESGLTPVIREDRPTPPPKGPGPSSRVESGLTKVAAPKEGGTTESDAADQQGLWQRLLQEVGGLKQIVVHYLENGRLISVGKGEVEIGVAGYDLQLAKENQQVIMEAVKRIWGEGKRVHLVPVSASAMQEAPGSAPVNGGPSEKPPENGGAEENRQTNSLKFMEELFRDADEIFGDAGPPPAAGAV